MVLHRGLRVDTSASLQAWLRQMLPAGCAAAVRAVTALPASLYPAEEALIARAVEPRRNEFRAGREAARAALSQLDCAPTAIPAHAERDPVWPRGFVGSIAHAGGMALAVAARAGQFDAVGVDIEEAAPLEPALVARICRDDERPQAPQLLAAGIDFGKLCFVAKEALLKALLPRRRAALRFDQLRVRFDAAHRRFGAWLHERAAPARGTPIGGLGRYGSYEGLLVAVFSIPVGFEAENRDVHV